MSQHALGLGAAAVPCVGGGLVGHPVGAVRALAYAVHKGARDSHGVLRGPALHALAVAEANGLVLRLLRGQQEHLAPVASRQQHGQLVGGEGLLRECSV